MQAGSSSRLIDLALVALRWLLRDRSLEILEGDLWVRAELHQGRCLAVGDQDAYVRTDRTHASLVNQLKPLVERLPLVQHRGYVEDTAADKHVLEDILVPARNH